MEDFFIMVTSSILLTISVFILIGFRSIKEGSNNHDKFVESIVSLILVTIVLCLSILIKLRVPLNGFDITYYLALVGSVLLLASLMFILRTKHNMYKKINERKEYYLTIIIGLLVFVILELLIEDNNIPFRLVIVYYVIAHVHLFTYGYHKKYRDHIVGIYLMTFSLIITILLSLLVLKSQNIMVLYIISSTQIISIIGFMLFFTSININQLYRTQNELKLKNDEITQLSDNLKESVLIDNTTGIGTKYNFSIESKQLEHINSIALINVRSFMEINQLAGFEAGNKILKTIAEFIQSILKEHEMVLRYDSDQFLITSIATPSNCKTYIESYKKDITHVDGFDLDFYGSIIPFDSSIEVQEVYKMLEVGIAQAKSGKDKFFVIDKESYNNSVKDIYFVSNLRNAINNNYFKVFYQPKYNMINEKIVSYEALARWIEGDSIISPGLFIPIAEEQDLIDDISKIVITQVFADMQSNWHNDRSISISITTDQLLDNDFLEFIIETAKKHSVAKNQIILEVTETIIDSDIDLLKASIDKLKKNGFKISLDDFGSGASSLYRFEKLDFDEIKFDKAFVNEKMKDDKVRTTFEKSVELFNSYEMTIVVEGVETKEQLESLKHLPIDQIQGFYFSKPLPLEDVRLLD